MSEDQVPAGSPASDAGPGVPAGRRRRVRSRTRRRALIAAGAVLALVISAVGVSYALLAGRIQTFPPGGVAKVRPPDIPATDILLIGTDARGGENTRLGGAGDDVGRSDTTILVHVYPGGKSAVGVSIPRDSLVTIPSCKLPNGTWTAPQPDTMFNAAFSVGETKAGNPACTQNTVEKMTGLHIDHTLVINFAGFAKMSRAVGGVPVCLPQDVYEGDLDPNLHAQGKLIFKAGRQLVSGAAALQYVRVRHGLGDGSDIGRIQRQQAFLASLVVTIKKKGLEINHILPLVKSATASITFDSSLSSPRKLLSFAKGLTSLNPKNIDFVTVPWRYDGARVAIVQPDANELWAALRADRQLTGKGSTKGPALARGSGTLKVLNGTTISGLAARISTRLTKVGFVGTPGTAPTTTVTTSEIHYRPADAARAKLLARYLGASLVPDASAHTLTLVLGTSHRWKAGHTKKLPTSVTGNIRKATANACSNLTYG
ncbi:MAG: cell envelope-related transcriptional attenuator [Marmoricola sp.]|nr:cell envelope-related transcriptional attenuator [Marmoricola sp.]